MKSVVVSGQQLSWAKQQNSSPAYLRFSHQSNNAKLTPNAAPATLTHMGMIVLSIVTRHASNSRRRCRNATSASTTMVKVVNGFMFASCYCRSHTSAYKLYSAVPRVSRNL